MKQALVRILLALVFAASLAVVQLASNYFSVPASASGLLNISVAAHEPVLYSPNEEIVDKRTATSKTFYLGNARYSIDTYLTAIHYQRNPTSNADVWLNIDTTIVDGKVTKAPYDLDIHLTGKPGFHIKDKLSGEYDIQLVAAWDDKPNKVVTNNVSPVVSGNTVTWPEYYPGVDVILVAESSSVALKRLIKTPQAAIEYSIDILELSKGRARLSDVKPAVDASGQSIKMEQSPKLGGRIEKLKKEVIVESDKETRSITYPILDATIIDIGISATGDDGYRWGGGSLTTTGSTILIGAGSSAPYHTFTKFNGITIPADATASNSYLHYTAYYSGTSTTVNTAIYANDVASPTAPTNATEYDALALTGTSVAWNSISSWTAESTYNTPDISSVVQELVDSYGAYSSGSIMFMHRDNSSSASASRAPYDYSGSTTKCTQLHIEYTTPFTGDISNDPSTKDFGAVAESSTYYAYGGASYSNPVGDAECTFTLTNSGTAAKINIKETDPTGGVGWTLTAGAPGENTIRDTAVYSGLNPAGGIVLTTSYQQFIASLAGSGTTKKWDFKRETGTFTDVVQKTSTITLQAVAP